MARRELLLEIGCEELPASWIPGLEAQLAERLAARLDAARIVRHTPVRAFAGPRRLAATVAELADRQSDLEETVTGPPVRAAFDAAGRPTRAALGFARRQGVDVVDLERVETGKGAYLTHRRRQRGATTRSVLGGVLGEVLRDLAFPKAMRWDAALDDGRGELLFGRPIRWLLLLYGGRVAPFVIGRTAGAQGSEAAPVRAGNVTWGHRFFAREGRPGQPLEVTSFADYRRRLERACVLIDRGERRARVRRRLAAGARKAGGVVAPLGAQSALAAEVPDLVEHPAVVTGGFPAEFLELPDEVLSTTMVHHQHYFPVAGADGRLLPRFLAVTNTPRDNVARIARNAERVLVARLRDARFFWDADRARRLDGRLERLDTLLFHKRLGSYRAKAERVAALAGQIARDLLGRPAAAAAARRAGLLAKADLATDMVGEFPELQGLMGGVYAREQGEPEAVWKAVYHHYLPLAFDAGAPPSRDALGAAAATWAAVALADKADTVAGLFAAGEKPTGSRDPLGIRRQAQGMLRILIDLPALTGVEARVPIGALRNPAAALYGDQAPDAGAREREAAFLLDRLRYLLEARGFDRRNVRAVTHEPLDRLRPLDVRRKLEALPEIAATAAFRTLATLFKRVRNIARELPPDAAPEVSGGAGEPFETVLAEPAEQALLAALAACRPVIDGAAQEGAGFRAAFAEAAKIGPAVDRFFTEVFVMADDPTLRRARLRLARQVEQAILQLADVSEIVPEA